ncbi:MAG: hypothetical protein WC959_08280 [Kiritimatiellales bacterium]
MKKIIVSSMFGLMCVTQFAVADFIQKWTFDDPAGSSLLDAASSGPLSVNGANFTLTNAATDGAGNLIVSNGLGAANISLASQSITSGILSLEVKISGWDMASAIPAGGGTTREKFNFMFQGSGGTVNFQLFRMPDNKFDLRSFMTGGSYTVKTTVSNSVEFTMIVEFNIDDGEWRIGYNTGADTVYDAWATTPMANIGTFIISKEGEWNDDDILKIDEITLTHTIPEASSIQLILISCCAAVVIRKYRKK